MSSTLLELSELISSSVRIVDARCAALSGTYPDLNDAASINSKEDERLYKDAEIARATSVAIAAASQLIATMQYPSRTLLDASLAFLVSASLGVVAESSTAEIIREAGPQGCHVDDIAKRNGMDPTHIARVLRPLATQHIFRELSPNVFAHNRASALLDTGKASEAILAAPEDKHQGAAGVSAVIQLNTDESFKAGAYLQDVILDKTRPYEDEFNTPFNRAFNADGDLFSWYERPENKTRFRRFGMAMDVSRKMAAAGEILQGFKWSSLPEKALVVDVGGGIGSTSLQIAKAHSHLSFVVQDRQDVLTEGAEHWESELPGITTAGRIAFQAHDFFSPQPVKNADIFILRFICHDWSDIYTLKILKHLRASAQSTTKLIVMEQLVQYVCGEDEHYKHIPGAVPVYTPPKPLLANMGTVAMVPYLADLQMMSLLSGCERTFPHFWDLLKQGGWEIEEVHRPIGSLLAQLVAKPV